MIDKRAELAALQLGLVPLTHTTGHDREVERGDHGHRSVVLGLEKLLREDRTMGGKVEPRCELGEPARVAHVRSRVGLLAHL